MTNTSTSFETCFPIADATLTIPLDWIEALMSTLLDHGVNVEQKDKNIYIVYFPEGTVSIELLFTKPQQHKILFPDGFSFLMVDLPREEGEQQKRNTIERK